ncbi:Brix domain containing protein, putative [Babesia bigemina]|uniref:Ribosome production factor 2 homolog n=1 Tax=Babesia bigemina TaxID=5866 RepID=A0A061D928_BABBI|nr:Brix domain containing protein, putative [Babesia bigemina]CDR95399.1 Brix domain containing protein, putative [Babesia bigemina]|eukprot:XP_012767585.1 Brix domain containing protein, putative [Babesia bigemina]
MKKGTGKKCKKSGTEELKTEPEAKKQVLFMLSSSHSAETKQLLKDLFQLCKPSGFFRENYHNDVDFEDNVKIQINQYNHRIAAMVCNRMDCGLYVVASSNKKRPMGIGLGRIYDGKMLDCCQLRVTKYVPFDFFKGPNDLEISHYSYPLVLAQGAHFGEENGPMRTTRDILLDVFRPPATGMVSLESIQQVIVLTSVDADATNTADAPKQILFRRYQILFRKSDDDPKIPRVDMKEIGPQIDFELVDCMEADPEVFKHATAVARKPKKLVCGVDTETSTAIKRRKNVSTTALGHTEGRVYLDRQSLDKLYTPHTKTLKSKRSG